MGKNQAKQVQKGAVPGGSALFFPAGAGGLKEKPAKAHASPWGAAIKIAAT
jgi:hypothetical protein